MESQLKDLLEAIRTEGVEAAEKKAAEIISEAKAQADEIVEKAKGEGQKIVQDAKREAATFQAAAGDTIRQAGRDVVISVKKEITEVLDGVVKAEVSSSFSGDDLAKAIQTLVESWGAKQDDKLEVLVPADQLKTVEGYLKKKLAEKLLSGLTITPVKRLKAGFSIGKKDGAAYYDFSDEGISEILSAYVSPRIADILSGVKEG